MAAPKGNKNAEKWDFEKASELLDDLIFIAEEEEFYPVGSGANVQLIPGYKYDFIGEIALKKNVYHELITRDIPNRFPELKHKSDMIIRLMERNCYSNTKKGIINTAVGIVNLKSNHKWTDRQDVTTKGNEITVAPIQWVKNE